jgi:sugar/nucleoside kinase (ribokinase family)
MSWDVAGMGNAIMDALVIIEDDALLDELGLIRGTMHPVDHDGWSTVYNRVRHLDVAFESGGSCANTIATLGRLGARSIYCGRVGDDELGRIYAERIQASCGQHALRVAHGVPTGKCLSLVSAADAERTMITDLGASIGLDNLGDFGDQLSHTKIAHFTGYTLLDGPMLPVILQAMKIAKAGGALISLDVADPFVVQGIRGRLWEVIDEHADIVFLNAEEARALTDQSPEQAVERIARHARVQTVVVKLGSRGSMVWRDGEVHAIGVRKVHAIDSTGAGDAYAGGFLYGCLKGWDAARCGTLASAVAATAVSQLGAVVRDNDLLRSLVEEIAPRS